MDLGAALGVGELSGILLIIAGVTVWAINRLRSELYEHTKWALKVPSYVWWSLSFLIPLGVCYALSLDMVRTVVLSATEGIVDLDTDYGPLASAVVATASSNGTFAGLKKLGLTAVKPAEKVAETATYSATVSGADNVVIPPAVDTQAQLFMRVHPPLTGPGYYVWVNGALYPVQTDKEKES